MGESRPAELAARLYAERHRGRGAIRELDFRIAHALLGRAETGDGDLLSYILFDEAFVEQAIQLGIQYARRKVAARSPSPWLPPLGRSSKPVGKAKGLPLDTELATRRVQRGRPRVRLEPLQRVLAKRVGQPSRNLEFSVGNSVFLSQFAQFSRSHLLTPGRGTG